MKTGFTDEAKYCLSGTAERNGMQLIAVVLGASTSDIRFSTAKSLLDYGFANYTVTKPQPPQLEPITVKKGVETCVELKVEPLSLLTEKGSKEQPQAKAFIKDYIDAPVAPNQEVGYVAYYLNGTELARAKVTAAKEVKKVTYLSLLGDMFKALLFK